LRGVAAEELQRQHAHADQVGAVDALEAARNDGFDAQQLRAFRRPVARGAGAVFLAAEHHRGRALGDVAHGGVVDRHLFLADQREAAFLALQHEVLDAHVGEGAAHHHLVVAAARAVAVEVGHRHVVLLQEDAGGRGGLDRAGGRDVVGGHRVAEHAEDARAADRRGLDGGHGEAGEERRLGDVGRLRPVVHLAGRRGDLLPQRVGVGEVGIEPAEGRRVHRGLEQRLHLVRARPQVADEHIAAVLRFADRPQQLGGIAHFAFITYQPNFCVGGWKTNPRVEAQRGVVLEGRGPMLVAEGSFHPGQRKGRREKGKEVKRRLINEEQSVRHKQEHQFNQELMKRRQELLRLIRWNCRRI